MPKFIVIIFYLLYLIFIVGFDFKGYVLERESVKTQAIKARRVLAGISQPSFPRSETCALHMIGMRRVSTGWRQLCFASISRVRPSRETFCFANLYYLIHTFCIHTIYTHITHICWGVHLRENLSQTPWELEIIIPIYLYTYACGFSQLLPLHFHSTWEVDSPNT